MNREIRLEILKAELDNTSFPDEKEEILEEIAELESDLQDRELLQPADL